MISLPGILELLLLSVALAGAAPLYPHLEALPKILLPLAAAAGVLLARKRVTVPPWLLTLAALILSMLYIVRFRTGNVVVPASNLLAALLAIRLVGERSGRAILQSCALGLFCLAASTLFSLGPLFFVSLVLLMLLIVSTLLLTTFQESDPALMLSTDELLNLGKLLVAVTGTSAPLMLLFFAILPRTQYPLWDAFAGSSGASSGIADRVQPGSSANIGTSRDIAFRAVLPQRDPSELYWRSVVFNVYTAGAWIRRPPPAGEVPVLKGGTEVHQEIFPEPGRLTQLPALNIPVRFTGIRSITSGDLVTRPSALSRGRARYEAASIPSDRLLTRLPPDNIFYLRLPAVLPSRLAEAASDIARRGKTDRERLQLASSFFRSLNIRYANTGLPTGPDALHRFLFTDKRGHCEFFASSFALLMRAAGVPARVVGGFYGGSYNEIGGYYAVSNDCAHAWTEVYIESEGWQTVDPSRWSAGFAEIGSSRSQGAGRRLATALDTITYYWDVAVITYDLDRQLQLAGNTAERFQGLSQRFTVRGLTGYATAAGVLAAVIILLLRWRRHSPEEKLARRFMELAWKDGSCPASAGLNESAQRLNDPLAFRFASIYGNAVYRDRRLTREERRELGRLIRLLGSRTTRDRNRALSP